MDLQEKEYSVHYPILWSYMRTEKKSNVISNMKKMWTDLLQYIEEKYPDIPVHSLEAERKLAEKERWLTEKQRKRNISEEIKKCTCETGTGRRVFEKAIGYLYGLKSVGEEKAYL